MPENTANIIKVWQLSEKGAAVNTDLPDHSSLDAVTRQLPPGLYTTFRTYGERKRVLGLQAHLQRLYQPEAGALVKAEVPAMELRQALAEILGAYSTEARVRLVMTNNGQIFVAIEALKPLPPEIYSLGVKVVTTGVERQTPRLKSTTFISASQSARKKIAESHVFEALLVRKDRILEGMTSNFFYVMGGKLGTARKDILLGVTRRTVLRVARGSGLEILYRPLKREQIPALTEAFLTSSSRELVPIIQIDDIPVGEGRPGPVTRLLMEDYKTYVLQKAEEIDPRQMEIDANSVAFKASNNN